MKLRMIAATSALVLSLSACGQAAEEAADAAFDTGFSRSCVEAASAGLGEEQATSLCACALTKINENYTAEEKQALSPEAAQPLMQQCIQEAGLMPAG